MYIHTYIHACMHACIDRQTDRQAGRQTDRHTYIYIYTHIHTIFMYIRISYGRFLYLFTGIQWYATLLVTCWYSLLPMFLIVLEGWGAFFGVWIKVKYYKCGLFSMQMIETFLFCTVFNLTQTVLGCWLGTSPTLGLNIVNQTRPQCRKNVWHCGPVSLWEANKCQSGPWWGCEVIYSIAHLRGSEL